MYLYRTIKSKIMNQNQPTIAILAGGGPASGLNAVVAGVAKTFIQKGYRVIGLHGGFEGLFTTHLCAQSAPDLPATPCGGEGDVQRVPPSSDKQGAGKGDVLSAQKTEDIDYHLADEIFNRGGSMLRMSRFKPSDTDFETRFNLDFFTENNVRLLVTIGGDDTASTANRISKFLVARNYPIANIHVPKTIDNDLPLPNGVPTFGYESALDKGAVIGRAIYVDAHSSGNWFVLSAMGRSAGHLAFGIGEACHYPMIIIPEMFDKTRITVDKIISLIVSSVVKRRIMGMDYGAAIISEGVFHSLDHKEIAANGIQFSYDAHGHPELGKIPKAAMFSQLLDKRMAELGIAFQSRPVELGYELRSQTPIAYDLTYCTELGIGVWKLFSSGCTGCMVYVDACGNVTPLYLNDLQDASGKIPPRMVDISSDRFRAVVDNILLAITPRDYEAARQYLTNPEAYDFLRILEWNEDEWGPVPMRRA